MEAEIPKLLSDLEVQTILHQFLKSRKDKGITKHEAIRMVKWAEGIRVGSAMLELILDREVVVDFSGQDVCIQADDKFKKGLRK
jgi:hypothetical protein